MNAKRRITKEEQEARIEQIKLEEQIIDAIPSNLPMITVIKALANVLKAFVGYL